MCCAVIATLLPEANFILPLVGTASRVQPDVKKTE
jgi:hypothetical protein